MAYIVLLALQKLMREPQSIALREQPRDIGWLGEQHSSFKFLALTVSEDDGVPVRTQHNQTILL